LHKTSNAHNNGSAISSGFDFLCVHLSTSMLSDFY
jgi:hypothetical protein